MTMLVRSDIPVPSPRGASEPPVRSAATRSVRPTAQHTDDAAGDAHPYPDCRDRDVLDRHEFVEALGVRKGDQLEGAGGEELGVGLGHSPWCAGHAAGIDALTAQKTAEHLDHHLAARGAGVVIEVERTCMSLRGVRGTGARTATWTQLGTLRADLWPRAAFLSLARSRRQAC